MLDDFNFDLDHKQHARKFSILHNQVVKSLEDYLSTLDGHKPFNLYELVLKEFEFPMFEIVLRYSGGNQSMAAKILGLSRGTLRKKLKQYKLCKNG